MKFLGNYTKKSSPRQVLAGVISFIFIVTVLISGIFLSQKEKRILSKYGVQTTGKVVKIANGRKRVAYYSFSVNGTVYKTSRLLYDAKNPVFEGDKFYVTYYPEDPDVNRIDFKHKVLEPLKLDTVPHPRGSFPQ